MGKLFGDLVQEFPSPSAEEKRAARFFYEMLCDYVHPNVGAHTLVVSKAELVSKGQMRWELSREPDSDEALSVLVHAVAIPVRASIRTLLPDCSVCSITSVNGSGGANL